MDDQQSGQRYVPLFQSNIFRFLNIAIFKRDEWQNITDTINNYEDNDFLDSLWCPDKCDDWFSSVKKNENMKSFSRKDAVTLCDFIEKVKPFWHLILNL